MAISMAIEGVIGYITGGKAGLKQGLINGAINGFMWGGIASALSALSRIVTLNKCGSVKSGSCFVAGTLVPTENGVLPIEEINVGDKIYSHNPSSKTTDLKNIAKTIVRYTDEVVEINISGFTITTTKEHPFWVFGKGWIPAGELTTNDLLVNINGECLVIDNITIHLLEEKIPVYNVEVSDYHTYYVSDLLILVHNANCGGFKNLRTLNNTKIKGYKVSMDVERGGSGLINIHLKVDNTKYFFKNGKFISSAGKELPKVLRNHPTITNALEKALKYITKGAI